MTAHLFPQKGVLNDDGLRVPTDLLVRVVNVAEEDARVMNGADTF